MPKRAKKKAFTKRPGSRGARNQARNPIHQVVRDELGRFVKGHSGNPAGRPVEYREFVDEVRKVGGPVALLTLLSDLDCGHPPSRVKAAETLLAYAWGRPRQAVELTGRGGGPVELSDARNRLAAMLERRLAALETKPTVPSPPSGATE